MSAGNEALITKLLADFMLMRDMLVAGGAVSSETEKGSDTAGWKYGQAMGIYTNITKASAVLRASITDSAAPDAFWDDRSQGNILKRVALGTALEHAVPIHQVNHGLQLQSLWRIHTAAVSQHVLGRAASTSATRTRSSRRPTSSTRSSATWCDLQLQSLLTTLLQL